MLPQCCVSVVCPPGTSYPWPHEAWRISSQQPVLLPSTLVSLTVTAELFTKIFALWPLPIKFSGQTTIQAKDFPSGCVVPFAHVLNFMLTDILVTTEKTVVSDCNQLHRQKGQTSKEMMTYGKSVAFWVVYWEKFHSSRFPTGVGYCLLALMALGR